MCYFWFLAHWLVPQQIGPILTDSVWLQNLRIFVWIESKKRLSEYLWHKDFAKQLSYQILWPLSCLGAQFRVVRTGPHLIKMTGPFSPLGQTARYNCNHFLQHNGVAIEDVITQGEGLVFQVFRCFVMTSSGFIDFLMFQKNRGMKKNQVCKKNPRCTLRRSLSFPSPHSSTSSSSSCSVFSQCPLLVNFRHCHHHFPTKFISTNKEWLLLLVLSLHLSSPQWYFQWALGSQ